MSTRKTAGILPQTRITLALIIFFIAGCSDTQFLTDEWESEISSEAVVEKKTPSKTPSPPFREPSSVLQLTDLASSFPGGKEVSFVIESEEGFLAGGDETGFILPPEDSSLAGGDEAGFILSSKDSSLAGGDEASFILSSEDSSFAGGDAAVFVLSPEDLSLAGGDEAVFTFQPENQPLDERDKASFFLRTEVSAFPESDKVDFVEMDLSLKDIFFAVDSSDLSDEAREVLDENIKQLNRRENIIRVVLEGHCDSLGSENYNMALGLHRAESVKQYLILNGIPDKKLEIISYGETRPLSYTDKAQNRRVSFFVSRSSLL